MIINIFGSTGVIGKKTLELIDLNFPQIKVNLLCAKSNITLLKKQTRKVCFKNPWIIFIWELLMFLKKSR